MTPSLRSLRTGALTDRGMKVDRRGKRRHKKRAEEGKEDGLALREEARTGRPIKTRMQMTRPARSTWHQFGFCCKNRHCCYGGGSAIAWT